VEKEALRPIEAAAVIGVGRNRLRQLVASGELRSIRLGPRSTRIPVAALREWLSRKANGREPWKPRQVRA
jgi:excisionase family DNA binding protein